MKKFLLILIIGGMIVAPVVLIILPSGFFDNGESICPSVYFFNRECFGCGVTRGIMHLIHLDFKQAWAYNKLSYIVLPLLVYYYQSIFFKLVKKVRRPVSLPVEKA